MRDSVELTELMQRGKAAARVGRLEEARQYLGRAIELAPDEPGGYQMSGFLAQLEGDHDRAIALREKAVKIAPNDFLALWGLGSVLLNADQPQRALDIFERTRRLNPHYPVSLDWTILEANVVAGNHENAIQAGKRALSRNPDHVFPHIYLTAAYCALNRLDEAQIEVSEVRRINPKFNVSDWMLTRLYKSPETRARIAGLLISAGLPGTKSR